MLGSPTSWLLNNAAIILLALIIAVLFLCILLAVMVYKLNRLSKAYRMLMSGNKGQNLEELLSSYLAKVYQAEEKVQDLEQLCTKLEGYIKKSVQNVAVVRFNAFENTGGDLSFSTAFLDFNGDGLVLSSINSRDESRVYAKPVKGGVSSYHLSGEEQEAIKQAMTNNPA